MANDEWRIQKDPTPSQVDLRFAALPGRVAAKEFKHVLIHFPTTFRAA
jgi:hypothetical protein